MRSNSILLTVLLAAGTAACSDYTVYQDPNANKVAVPGSITGRICDTTGRTWLADALVYANIYNDDGIIVDVRQAYSDKDGWWTLNQLTPGREYQVFIQYGTEVIWSEEIYVGDGEDIELEQPECFDPLSLNIALITGDYDSMDLLLNNMGFANYSVIDGLDKAELSAFLTDSDSLEQYDIIFFNGGHLEDEVFYDTNPSNEVPDQVIANIRNYVDNGGSLYASDWAYDVIETVWPDPIDFLGDDGFPNAAQLGEYDQINAIVTDESLSDFLGDTEVVIEYDLPVWPPMTSVEGYVSIHLTGTVHYREGEETYTLASVPLLASFSGGQGRVVFSTFRVAANQSDDMTLIFQYMMYNVKT